VVGRPGLEQRTKLGLRGTSSPLGRLPEQIASKNLGAGAELDASPTRRRRGMRRLMKNLVAIAMSGQPDAEVRVRQGLRRVARLCRPATVPTQQVPLSRPS